MSVDEIVNQCKKYGVHNVTFTGGEPLIQKDADELIESLAKEGFEFSKRKIKLKPIYQNQKAR